MRVIVTLTIDMGKETRIEGDAQIFDTHIMPWLGDIGMWLENWSYCEVLAKPHKNSKVFVPWGSCLMVETLEELKLEGEVHICSYCLKRLSLGRTPGGWIGCFICQRKIDQAIQEFLKKKFGG